MIFRKMREFAFLGSNNGNKMVPQLGLINISIQVGGLYFLTKLLFILTASAWCIHKRRKNLKREKSVEIGSSLS